MAGQAMTAEQRRDAWVAAAPGRAYERAGERHVLRELGVLVASNRDLATAVDTAEKR